jgi:hypothetical protein
MHPKGRRPVYETSAKIFTGPFELMETQCASPKPKILSGFGNPEQQGASSLVAPTTPKSILSFSLYFNPRLD